MINNLGPLATLASSPGKGDSVRLSFVATHAEEGGIVDFVLTGIVGNVHLPSSDVPFVRVGQRLSELSPIESAALWRATLTAALRTGALLAFAGIDGTFELPSTDGMTRWRFIVDGQELTCWTEDPSSDTVRAVDYQLLVEHATDMILKTTPAGIIEWISPSVEKILGYAQAELIGVGVDRILFADDLVRRREWLERAEEVGAGDLEVRLVSRTGELKWFVSSVRPVSNDTGEVVSFVGALRQIEDLVAHRTQLGALRYLYELLVEHSTDVIFVETDGAIEWVSPSLRSFLGYLPDDWTGRSQKSLVRQDDQAIYHSRGEPVGSGGDSVVTVRVLHFDGSERWVEIMRHQVRDAKGRLLQLSRWRDVGAQIKSRERLFATEVRSRLVEANTDQIVLEVDLDGRILWASQSLQRTLGHAPRFVEHQSLESLIRAEDWEVARFQLSSATVGASTVEVRYLRSGGASRWMSQRAHRSQSVGRDVDTVLLTLTDITEEVGSRELVRHSLELLELLNGNVNDVVYTRKEDGTIEWISGSLTTALGWRASDVVGTSAPDIFSPLDVERARNWRRLVFMGESIEDAEFRVRRADGGMTWMRTKCKPLIGSSGTIETAVATMTSIDVEVVLRRALRTVTAGMRAQAGAPSRGEFLQRICDAAVDQGGYVLAWFGEKVYDDAFSVLPLVRSGDESNYVDLISVTWGNTSTSEGPVGRSIRFGQVSVVQNIRINPTFAPWVDRALKLGVESMIALPIRERGVVVGSLQIYAAERDAFGPDVLDSLTNLADHIGGVLERLDSRGD